jgi:hypothetical protein
VLAASCSGEGMIWERFLLAVRALRLARQKILLRGLLCALAWVLGCSILDCSLFRTSSAAQGLTVLPHGLFASWPAQVKPGGYRSFVERW